MKKIKKNKGKVNSPSSNQTADQKNKEDNKQTTSQSQSQSQSQGKTSIDVNIKANDAVVDEFSRFILKNPQYMDMFNSNDPRSYTTVQ